MKQSTRRIIGIFSLSLAFAAVCQAQQPSARLFSGERLTGKVKSLTVKRTYFVYKGRTVAPRTEVIGIDIFDREGRLVQSSIFGNGELRSVLLWSGNSYSATVAYFDSSGTQVPTLPTSFVANTDGVKEDGLCKEFTTALSKDKTQNIETETETCLDDSFRRRRIAEYSPDRYLLREITQDAKSRTWEYEVHYGVNFSIDTVRITIDAKTRPKYWHEVVLTNQQLDAKKNLIDLTATSTWSAQPQRVLYEFREQRLIEYYDK